MSAVAGFSAAFPSNQGSPASTASSSSRRTAGATVTTIDGRYAIVSEGDESKQRFSSTIADDKTAGDSDSSDDVMTATYDRMDPCTLAAQSPEALHDQVALLSRRDCKVGNALRSGVRHGLHVSPAKSIPCVSASETGPVMYELQKSKAVMATDGYRAGMVSAATSIGTVFKAIEPSTSATESRTSSPVIQGAGSTGVFVASESRKPSRTARRPSVLWVPTGTASRVAYGPDDGSPGGVSGLSASDTGAIGAARGESSILVKLRAKARVVGITAAALRRQGTARFDSTMSSLKGQLESRTEADITRVTLGTRRRSVEAGFSPEQADAMAQAASDVERGRRRQEDEQRALAASAAVGGSASMPQLPLASMRGAATSQTSHTAHAMVIAAERVHAAAAAAEAVEQVGARASLASSRGESVGRAQRRLSFVDVHARFVSAQAQRVKRELQAAVRMEAAAEEAVLAESGLVAAPHKDCEAFSVLSPQQRQSAMALLAALPGSSKLATAQATAAAMHATAAARGPVVAARAREEVLCEAAAVDRSFQADAEAVAAAARMPDWLHQRTDFRRIASAAHTGDALFVKHALQVPGYKRSPREIAAVVAWMRQFARFAGERDDYLATLAGALVMTKILPRRAQKLRNDVLLLVVEGAVEVRMDEETPGAELPEAEGHGAAKATATRPRGSAVARAEAGVATAHSASSTTASDSDAEHPEDALNPTTRRIVVGPGRGVGPVTRWMKLRDRLEANRHELQWQLEGTETRARRRQLQQNQVLRAQARPAPGVALSLTPQSEPHTQEGGRNAPPGRPPLLRFPSQASAIGDSTWTLDLGGIAGNAAKLVRKIPPPPSRRLPPTSTSVVVSEDEDNQVAADGNLSTEEWDESEREQLLTPLRSRSIRPQAGLADPHRTVDTPLDSLDPQFRNSSPPRSRSHRKSAVARVERQRRNTLASMVDLLAGKSRSRSASVGAEPVASPESRHEDSPDTARGSLHGHSSPQSPDTASADGLALPDVCLGGSASPGPWESASSPATRRRTDQSTSARSLGAGFSPGESAPLRRGLLPGQPLREGSEEDVAGYWRDVRRWLLAEAGGAGGAAGESSSASLDLRGSSMGTLVLPPGAVFPASLEEALQSVAAKQADATTASVQQSLWRVVNGAVQRGRDLQNRSKQLMVRALPRRAGGAISGAYVAELRLSDLAHSVRHKRLAAKQLLALSMADQFRSLFKGWRQTRLLALAHVLRERQLPRPGAVLWRQDDAADGVVLVLEGCVDVIREVHLATAHRFPASRTEWRVDFAEDTEPVLVRSLTAGDAIGGESMARWVHQVPGAALPATEAEVAAHEARARARGAVESHGSSSDSGDSGISLPRDHPLVAGGGGDAVRTFTVMTRTPSRVLYLPAADARMLAHMGVMHRLLRRARRDETRLHRGRFEKLALESRRLRAEQRGVEIREVLPHYRPRRWAARNAHMTGLAVALGPLTGLAPPDTEVAAARRHGPPGGGAGGGVRAGQDSAALSASIDPRAARRLLRGALDRGRSLGGLDSLSASTKRPFGGSRLLEPDRSLVVGSLSVSPTATGQLSAAGTFRDGGSYGSGRGTARFPLDSLSRLSRSGGIGTASVSSLPSLASRMSVESLAPLASSWGGEAMAEAAPQPEALAALVGRKKAEGRALELLEQAERDRGSGRVDSATAAEAEAVSLLQMARPGRPGLSAAVTASGAAVVLQDAERASRGWADPLRRLELLLDGQTLGAATANAAAAGGGMHSGGAVLANRSQQIKAQLSRDELERRGGARRAAGAATAEAAGRLGMTADRRETASGGQPTPSGKGRAWRARATRAMYTAAAGSTQRSKLFSPMALATHTAARRGIMGGGARGQESGSMKRLLSGLDGEASSGHGLTAAGREASVGDLPRAPARVGLSMSRVRSRYRNTVVARSDVPSSSANATTSSIADRAVEPSRPLTATRFPSGLGHTRSAKSLPASRPPTTPASRRDRAAVTARRRGLLPSSSFRISISSGAGGNPQPDALLSRPRGLAGGGLWHSVSTPGMRKTSTTPLGDLQELSGADTVSTHSSADSDRQLDVTEEPSAHDTSTVGNVRCARRDQGELEGGTKRKRRKRRMSATVEGNLKAGTLSGALGMPLGDEETMLVAQALMDAADGSVF